MSPPPIFGVRQVLRRYYAVWAAYSLASGFLFGVYPIFLRSRGLSQLEMNTVLATYFAVTFLTDVPTGALADALGRRRSLILGCMLRSLAFIVYFFAHRYAVFLVAESIDGIGTTFCNGAIDAWGVDALDLAGFAGTKDRMFSRASQLSNVGFMISAVIGDYAADINLTWPWILGAVGYAISAVLGARLMREGAHHHVRIDFAALPAMVSQRVIRGLKQGFRRRTIFLLSLASGACFAAWAPYWLEWQQFFNDTYGVGIWIIGWIFSLLTLARLAGAEAVVRLGGDPSQRGRRLSVLTAFGAIFIFAAGAVGHRPNLVLILLFGFNLCTGALFPMAQSWLNEQIGAGERATLLSFSNTFSTLGGSIGLLVGGVLADRAGIQAAWQLSGVISLAALPCYLALRRTGGAEGGASSPKDQVKTVGLLSPDDQVKTVGPLKGDRHQASEAN
jgi:MFS family permease